MTTLRAILMACLPCMAAVPQNAARPSPPALPELGGASSLVIPQARSFHLGGAGAALRIEAVKAHVRIFEQTARTTLEVDLRNVSSTQQEAVVLLPVPDGAVVDDFALDGAGRAPTARLLPRREAGRLYDRIVRRLREPALLEFHDRSLVWTSVFPVPAAGTQRARLTYEHVCQADGDRVDYVLPRSESLAVAVPWDISVEIRAKRPIALVYSPSHDITKKRRSDDHYSVRLKPKSRREPGSFLLSYALQPAAGISASLFAYPDPRIGGGYFLLLAGAPPAPAPGARPAREVTLVLDRSGSMAGSKMDQARKAALAVLAGLDDGELFQIIDYSTTAAKCFEEPTAKNTDSLAEARRYVADLQPGGGTNIHDALLEAMRPRPREGVLPLVFFLTDGLPTVGRTAETEIRDLTVRANPHKRRIFTFGVGNDVNVPLLDRLADLTRATTTYVLPQESVDVKVAQAFRKLQGPVLAAPRLLTLDADGRVDSQRVRELCPDRLSDLFENDRIVLLGQYRGREPLRFRLQGELRGEPRIFDFTFRLDKATTRNAFVPRLWASRRIAYLVDQVRQQGAATAARPQLKGGGGWTDPRLRELRDEILRLSTTFGVLSEYTSFLATEGTRLEDWNSLVRTCQSNLDGRAIRTRWGAAAVNQGCNLRSQKTQTKLNHRNSWLDQNLNRVETTTVQQIHDRAFFKRGKRWIDGRIIASGKFQPDETVEFGTPRHRELLEELTKVGCQAALSLDGDILLWTPGGIRLVRQQDSAAQERR